MALNKNPYPGGKGLSFRNFINLMPPHDIYIEPFLGAGSVFLHNRPASKNILIDISPAVIQPFISLHGYFNPSDPSFCFHDFEFFVKAAWQTPDQSIRFYCCDSIHYIVNSIFTPDTLIYCDPPYPLSSRSSGKIYDHELSDSDHIQLLSSLKTKDCMIMISSYPNSLYNSSLKKWNHIDFNSVVRSGDVRRASDHGPGVRCVERCWFNFDFPSILHDYSFIGSDFRERERIKRFIFRHISQLNNMPALERNALLHSIRSTFFLDDRSL